MSKRAIVCDTTVLLYLGRTGQSDLLPALFSPVYVPELVMLELDMGRLLRPDTINPRSLAWADPVSVSQAMIDDLPPNRLGAGERSVIGYARTLDDCVAGLDDLRARQLAEAVGLKVVGTLLHRQRHSRYPADTPPRSRNRSDRGTGPRRARYEGSPACGEPLLLQL